MANRRFEETGYRPFRVRPLLADGLLAVARPDGSYEQRAAAGLFRIAGQFGDMAQRQAERAGALAGEQAALAAKPQVRISGGTPGEPGEVPGGAASSTRGMRGDIRKIVSDAATKHGVDPNALLRIAMIESSGNPNAKNPNSSAGGLFQFIDATAKAYGLKNRYDPAEAADAAARLARDNARALQRALGRAPTTGELYLAHQQGAGGAIKLLRNPDGDAVATLGEKRVRLNGGRPGMTNAEFARLWTRKAGDGTAAVPLTIEAQGGGFQPTGADTAYGRAYDAAGVRAYTQMLETEMRSTTQQVFERYRDDPEQLSQALGELKGALKADHVFSEIEADYDIGFDRLAIGYLEQARERQRRRQEEQDRADFIERTATLETEQQKRIASFDPGSDDAADAIASSQTAIDDHFDAAVERGILTADAAAKAKLGSRRQAATGYYMQQASALDAAGVAKMRADMKADFGKGGIEGLDGEGWQSLDAELAKLEKAKKTAAEQVATDLNKRADAIAGRIAAGFDVDQAELARLALDSGATPEGRAAYAAAQAKIDAARNIRTRSVRDGVAYVEDLRRQLGDTPTPAQRDAYDFAATMLAAKRKAIDTDSVSYAEAQGLVPATPLLTDADSPEELEGIVAARIATAGEAAGELGTRVRYLKAGEAKAVADLVKADPAQGASLAASIVAGAGAAAPAVLAEFGDDAPMLAEAGSILAFGGSARAAEDVILGYGKGADGKQLKGLKPETASESMAEVTGGALALAGRDRERIGRAASAIARRRITEEGVDPASDEAVEIHRRAVQEAAGAVFDRGVQYGGFATVNDGWVSSGPKVLVPSSIRADRFGDVLAALRDEDFAALPVKPKGGVAGFAWGGGPEAMKLGPAATLAGATPVAVAGGYAFAFGDPASDDPQFVMGEDGGIFVLDLMRLSDRLGARVPGAFR